jgi:hypothetical protein
MPVYTYNTFDVPLALDTEPLGINDSGQIVGRLGPDPRRALGPAAIRAAQQIP